jgi:TolB-like protein
MSLLLAAALIAAAGSPAVAARRSGARVAVVPVSTDQPAVRKAAAKATRAIVKRLQRQGHRVTLVAPRQAVKLQRCLQEASCVETVGERMGVRYFVAAFAQRLGRAVHVDLRIIATRDGAVVASRAFERPSPAAIIGATAAVAQALLFDAENGVKVASASAVRGNDAQYGEVLTRSEAESAAQIVEVRDEEQPDAPKTAPTKKLALATGAGAAAALDAATPVVQRETSISVFSGRYWHAWTAAGAGVAALGAAAVFGVFSRKANRAALEADTQPEAWSLQDEARKNALGANVMFGVGGAALAASAILFFVEARQERREQRERLHLGINIARSGGQLTVQGRF